MAGAKRAREEEGAGGGERPRVSRVDAATSSYFEELSATLRSLYDDEERQLLADNALDEVEGREAEVAADAACSRVVEALLPLASPDRSCRFLTNCVAGDNLGAVCTR